MQNIEKRTKKQKLPLKTRLLKFFIGFLIPYIIINGIILFLFIQTPKIKIIENTDPEYEKDKIKFTINCLIPIADVEVYFQENNIPYTRFASYYIIDATNNGTYRVKVTAMNKAFVNSYIDIETRDVTPPIINVEDAIITGNTLNFSVSDSKSGINYDTIYAETTDGTKLNPTYIDKSSGTIEFTINKYKKLTVHVEDTLGNSSETTFNLN